MAATSAIPRMHETGPAFEAELRHPLSDAEALVEADRCLGCGGAAQAPCTVACPADIDVARFIDQIADGRPLAAAMTIFDANVLGGTCARVCPVEVLCEGACVLNHEGRRPVSVALLQRHATDRGLRQELTPVRHRTGAAATGRIAVVGAGPAGMTAAGELAARGHHVSLHDLRSEAGGLVRFAIAPFRQQSDPLGAELAMLRRMGVAAELGEEVDRARLRELEAECDAIVLAVGLGPERSAAFEGADLPGVHESLAFIEALKSGHPVDVGERAVVIGGGNTAIDVARELLRLGACRVDVLYRRTIREMPAFAHEVAEARAEGVRFSWLTAPTRFVGDGRLTGVECELTQLGPCGPDGRAHVESLSGTRFTVPADTAVTATGQQPRRDWLLAIPGIELENGRVVADPETGLTGNPLYYVAGDALDGGATVVEAVREAKLAAAAIDRALQERLA